MDKRTLGQRWADAVTLASGSWAFIIFFSVVCAIWIAFNSVFKGFDPYPFMFLNWVLTIVSTLQNPLIMLSQNRQNETDHERMTKVLEELESLKQVVLRLEVSTCRIRKWNRRG